MKRSSSKLYLSLTTTMLATACLGFGSHKSANRGTEVTLIKTAKFNNGATLPSGTYRMEVPENTTTPKVIFYHDGKAMATVNATVVNEDRKNSTTEVDSTATGDAQVINAIRPDGWNEELDFAGSGM